MQSLPRYVFETSAVHIVACEGVTYMCEVDSYLMSASGLRTDFHKRILFAGFKALVARRRGLTVLSDAAEYYRLAFPRYRSVDTSGLRRCALDCRVVDLSAASLQQTCRVSVLCDYAQPGGILVKAVHRAEREVGVQVSEEVAEGVALMLYRGVYRDAGWLVENDKALGLVNDRYPQFRIWLKSAAVLKAENYLVAGEYRVDAPYLYAAARYAVFLTFKPCQETP